MSNSMSSNYMWKSERAMINCVHASSVLRLIATYPQHLSPRGRYMQKGGRIRALGAEIWSS